MTGRRAGAMEMRGETSPHERDREIKGLIIKCCCYFT
jgi:hypothetical protein